MYTADHVNLVLTEPEQVLRRKEWEQRFGAQSASPLCLQGIASSGRTDMYVDSEQRVREALADLAEHADMLNDLDVFRPLCVDSGLHGVHFVDRIFGAEVYELDGEAGNWQAHYLGTPVGTLERPDLDTHPTWMAVREFAQAFVASGVTVPVLMLPTIASALNIGLNLYGQELLIAMLTEPPAAHHDLGVINEVLLEIHAWYRANIPHEQLHQVCCHERFQPRGCGQICGCSTQLISVDQYSEFVAARDSAILSSYPNGGMIHLCGSHTQHIPVWREMQSLRALQVNDRAAQDLEIYLREMPDQIYYVNPCVGMPKQQVARLAGKHRIVICGEPTRSRPCSEEST